MRVEAKEYKDAHSTVNAGSKYRKRKTLRMLDARTRLDIVKMASSKQKSGQEIADLFDIKVQAVRDLVKDAKKKRVYFINKRARELDHVAATAAIVTAIQEKITCDESIWSARVIKERVQEKTGLHVSAKDVIRVMKGKLNFRYRKVKRVSGVGNSDHNKVLRSLYAQKMLQIYNQGMHVISIDESWVPCSDFRRACWNRRGINNSHADKVLGQKLNMITAVSSEGYVWMALTQCNTNEDVFQMFMAYLSRCLTKKFGNGWREQIVCVMDGASYHRSAATRRCVSHLRMQVVLSAPYSYSAASAELWFSLFKRGDFNQGDVKTGRK